MPPPHPTRQHTAAPPAGSAGGGGGTGPTAEAQQRTQQLLGECPRGALGSAAAPPASPPPPPPPRRCRCRPRPTPPRCQAYPWARLAPQDPLHQAAFRTLAAQALPLLASCVWRQRSPTRGSGQAKAMKDGRTQSGGAGGSRLGRHRHTTRLPRRRHAEYRPGARRLLVQGGWQASGDTRDGLGVRFRGWPTTRLPHLLLVRQTAEGGYQQLLVQHSFPCCPAESRVKTGK